MYACIQIFNFKHESIFSSMDCSYNQSASMNPHIHAMKLVNQRMAEYFFSASNKPARAYQHVLVLSTRRRGRSAGARLRHDTQVPYLSDIQEKYANNKIVDISVEIRSAAQVLIHHTQSRGPVRVYFNGSWVNKRLHEYI